MQTLQMYLTAVHISRDTITSRISAVTNNGPIIRAYLPRSTDRFTPCLPRAYGPLAHACRKCVPDPVFTCKIFLPSPPIIPVSNAIRPWNSAARFETVVFYGVSLQNQFSRWNWECQGIMPAVPYVWHFFNLQCRVCYGCMGGVNRTHGSRMYLGVYYTSFLNLTPYIYLLQ